MSLFPVIDDDVVPGVPQAETVDGLAARMPLMLGTTTEEHHPFLVSTGLCDAVSTEMLPGLAARYGLADRGQRDLHREPTSASASRAQRWPESGDGPFGVRATAGTPRACTAVVFDHTWCDEGVVVPLVDNGAQVLHLSVAQCVLNDTYRGAARLGNGVDGVVAAGDDGFDEAWCSTGIEYVVGQVTVDARASARRVARLSAVVDEVAEIPRAIRVDAPVTRRN